MTTPLPLVTIVTPAFNCAQFVEETYNSIAAQTLTSWEWRVVNDASTDETAGILRQIADNDTRVILTHLPRNAGAADARNTAIATARGRFIAFLDADDMWHREKLERQYTMMQQTGAGLSYTAYDIIDVDGNLRSHISVPPSTCYKALLKHNVIGCLTAMYDTQVHGKVTMPPMRKRQDYGLWLKLLRNGGIAKAVPGTLATYRRLSGSLSSNKMSAAAGTWTVYRQMENLDLPRSLYYFAHYAIGTIARRIKQNLAMHMQENLRR